MPIRCRERSMEIAQLRTLAGHNRAVGCLPRLAKHPTATFGQRLTATGSQPA